ncbi:MAG: tetratricopeptide repeat protein [Planctomycetaceae bacterium]
MSSPPDFDALWNFNDPVTTEQTFREILKSESAENSSDRPDWQWELLTQIARAQGLQRKFDDAHATLDSVEEQAKTKSSRVGIRYLLERGRVFNSSKKPDEATPLFLKAWEAAREAGEDALAIDAAHMLAIVADPQNALDWNQQALELATTSPNPTARRWAGSLHNNIGWTHHGNGDYSKALEHFEKALACREREHQTEEIPIARWCLARCLRSLGKIAEALEIQKGLLAEHREAGTTDGYVFEELAECQWAMGMQDKAREHFAMAYAELSQDRWLMDNEPDRINRLRELGAVD